LWNRRWWSQLLRPGGRRDQKCENYILIWTHLFT
jgi:hypothetical protein